MSACRHGANGRARPAVDIAQGGSLIPASHNTFQMQVVCSRSVLMDEGCVIFDGTIEHCVDRAIDAPSAEPAVQTSAQPQSPPARVLLAVSLPTDRPGHRLRTGGNVDVTVHYRAHQPGTVLFCVSIWSADGSSCLAQPPDISPVALRPATGQKCFHIKNLPLAYERYSVRAVLVDPETMFGIVPFGYDNAHAMFLVEDDVSRIAIIARAAGQILKLPSAWSDIGDWAMREPFEV
jgi:hypothetical protein